MNEDRLTTDELTRLVRGVFRPGDGDRGLAVLADLPDERLADSADWRARRELAADWRLRLESARGALGLERVDLVLYRNARRNNADLPETAWCWEEVALPASCAVVQAPPVPMASVFDGYSILLALTELSATAPLKLAAPRHGFRAATMPGFKKTMVPALRLDYEEIHAECSALATRLDAADGYRIRFRAAGTMHELYLDLRHRTATASGGLVRVPGTAGNLPSGETYIVPYEGEISGDVSRTHGELPLQLDGELMVLEIEKNRVTGVRGDGPVAARERAEFIAEPAYANVAELGIGVLGKRGIQPVGEILLDEKLGLHIAFGRSDHFGGTVGAKDFSAPDRVVHIDRVYLPQLQPAVSVVDEQFR